MQTLVVGGVPEHFNLPWHLANANGDFHRAGINLDWRDQHSGTGQMMAALADGDLDIAVALTDGTIKAIADGNPSKIVRLYTTSPLQWGVHTSAAGPIDDESQITADHRYAISRFGSGSHLMAYVLADRLGITLHDEDSFVVVGTIDGAHEALLAGDAEVFLWDKFMTSPLVEAGDFSLAGVQPTPWPSFTIAVRDDVLAEHREPVKALLDVAARWAKTFEGLPIAEATAAVASHHHLDPAVAADWFSVTTWSGGEPVDPTTIGDAIATLSQLGVVEPVEAASLIEPGI